jgi:hypothetical protein
VVGWQRSEGERPRAESDLDDLELLTRFEPVIRFNEGEYFLPASVEAFVGFAELWERNGPSSRERIAASGTLDLARLVELTDGQPASHYLRLVSQRPSRSEYYSWQLRRDRPRFRAETRLGRVGVLTRLVDAGTRLSLLARGRTPRGAQAAAALLDRDRPDHGDHPYYGRVVRDGGYTVLQYWFFSFFNDWRSRAYGVNDHEGDWEQVTIYLVDAEPGVLQMYWVAFSAHDEVGPDLRRRWDDPDLELADGHPVVHAGLGSHAGAVLPGEYLITVRTNRQSWLIRSVRTATRYLQPWTHREDQLPGLGIPYVEYARGDGVAIGPGGDRPWRPVVISDDTPWVRSYTGLWGDDTNDPFGGERGPAGPRYERNASVRRSWSDPVGWAALDAVMPSPAERHAVITARIDELAEENARISDERVQQRRRLRAADLAGVTNHDAGTRELADLAARATINGDELDRLERALVEGAPAIAHPHAHLHHRVVPLPAETRERRRLLRIWATLSTPLLLLLLALAVASQGPSLAVLAVNGIAVVLAIEALTRRRLLSAVIRLVLALVVVSVAVVLVTGLIASWRITLVAVLVATAAMFMMLNLRELRRT